MFIPSGQAAKPAVTASQSKDESMLGSPAPNMNIWDVCKHAASRLNIPWPAVVMATRSHYEGKKLPQAKKMAKQIIPVFRELFKEVQI